LYLGLFEVTGRAYGFGKCLSHMHNDEGMYEMITGSFLRGVYDGIFLLVVKRHLKKEGRKEGRIACLLNLDAFT
jgi:hypothetical protein